MPVTVNSVGTRYSGADNVTVRRDRCEHCGRVADLTSYDTRLFFVVLFIPLIPISRKRIINQCSSCRRHYAMPMEQWERQRLEKLGGAVNDWAADRDNPELATRAVCMSMAFEAKEEFLAMTRSFTPALALDSEFMANVGDAYGRFGMRHEQIAAYRTALNVGPTPQLERALGVQLLNSGENEEGIELIRSAVRSGVENPAPSMFAAVGVLQGQGRHVEALDLLDELVEAAPGLAKDKGYLKVRKASEKNKETGKPIKGFKPPATGWVRNRPGTGLSTKAWGWLLAGAAALTAGFMILAAIIHTRETDTWLVNGLSVPERVDVDGKVYSVPPMAASKIRVSQGEHKVHVVEPAGLVPDQTVVVETSLLARPFVNPTFAINPDELGVLIERDIVYSQNPQSTGSRPKWTLHRGKVLHRFSVDYGFVSHPHSLQMSKSASTEVKTKVEVFREMTTADLLERVYATESEEAAKSLTLLGLARDPWNEGYLHGLALLDPADALKALEPGLAVRPLVVETHKLNQDLRRRLDARVDLVPAYKKLLDADPKNAAAIYLLGRVSPQPEHDRLYAEAAAVRPALPAAIAGWAHTLLDRNEFAKAAEVVSQARRDGGWSPEGAEAERYALICMGKHEEALKLPEMAKQPETQSLTRGLTGTTAAEKVCLLAMTGKLKDAQWLAGEVKRSEINEPDDMTNYLQSVAEYAAGNIDAAAAELSAADPELQARALLMRGKLDEANKAIDAMEHASFNLLLDAGVTSASAGDTKGTSEYTGRLAKMLEGYGPRAKTTAQLMRGRGDCTAESLDDLSVDFRQRASLLVLIAAAHPGACEEALRRAAEVNKLEMFPSREVRRAIERLGKH